MDLSPERCTARADGTLGGISLSTFSSAHLDLWKGTVVVKHKEAHVLQLNLGALLWTKSSGVLGTLALVSVIS